MEEVIHQKMMAIITQVIKINEKYEEIKKIKGENFNLFSILKLERNEVQTHSNFIYELLNPKGSHNQGPLFLKLFLENTLNLKEEEYGNIQDVKQEHLTIENRRIDLVIKTDNYQIGIEMKLDASDQPNQLFDYKNELDKAGKRTKLYYLTLTGYEASDDSTRKKLQANEDYFLLSFEDDIYSWIDACMEKSATIPLLREGLVHYRNLLSKITNKKSAPMEKEMKNIIKTPKEVEAVQILLNEYPKIWAKKEMEFWSTLKDSLEDFCKEHNYQFRDDELFDDNIEGWIENIKRSRETQNGSAAIQLEKKYQNQTSVYLVVNQTEGVVNISLTFWDKEDERAMNPDLSIIGKEIGYAKVSDKDIRYKTIDEKIIFYSRYQIEPTYDLFDNREFNRYVERVKNEVMKTIEQIEKHEKEIIQLIK